MKSAISNDELKQIYSLYSPTKTTKELNRIMGSIFKDFDYNNNIRSLINSLIVKNYPNEIVIKSSFIKNYLIKDNSSVTFFEMPVNKSRVDLCKVNGHSTAFEIKTDLDNLDRLDKQIEDYSKVFEEIYIICSESRTKEILNHIPESVGIYSYHQSTSGKYFFTKKRKAISFSNKLDSLEQLKTLTKRELKYYFNITETNNRESIYKSIIDSCSPNDINNIYKKILKSRYLKQWSFLANIINDIYDIDYQFFFKNNISPLSIYK